MEAAVLRAPLSSHGAVAVQALALGLEWSSKAKCHISEFVCYLSPCLSHEEV